MRSSKRFAGRGWAVRVLSCGHSLIPGGACGVLRWRPLVCAVCASPTGFCFLAVSVCVSRRPTTVFRLLPCSSGVFPQRAWRASSPKLVAEASVEALREASEMIGVAARGAAAVGRVVALVGRLDGDAGAAGGVGGLGAGRPGGAGVGVAARRGPPGRSGRDGGRPARLLARVVALACGAPAGPAAACCAAWLDRRLAARSRGRPGRRVRPGSPGAVPPLNRGDMAAHGAARAPAGRRGARDRPPGSSREWHGGVRAGRRRGGGKRRRRAPPTGCQPTNDES